MSDKKKYFKYFLVICVIITIYSYLFYILSDRETSTLKAIRKHLSKNVAKKNETKIIKNQTKKGKNSLLENAKNKLPFYNFNESLASYANRMIILKQKGFWEIKLKDVIEKANLFKVLKNEVENLLTSNKKNELFKLEKELSNIINKTGSNFIENKKIFEELLQIKLIFYSLTEGNSVNTYSSIAPSNYGKYLLALSVIFFIFAVRNLTKKKFDLQTFNKVNNILNR